MKAQQIAAALGNVYALGPLGQVRSIDRGEDGLWGRWRASGATAKRIVHGGAVIGTLGPDDRVSTSQTLMDLMGPAGD